MTAHIPGPDDGLPDLDDYVSCPPKSERTFYLVPDDTAAVTTDCACGGIIDSRGCSKCEWAFCAVPAGITTEKLASIGAGSDEGEMRDTLAYLKRALPHHFPPASVGGVYVVPVEEAQDTFIFDDALTVEEKMFSAGRQIGQWEGERIAAMSHDAGSIGGPPASITHRREAWDALESKHQNDVREKLADILARYKWHSVGAETTIDAILAAVLDG